MDHANARPLVLLVEDEVLVRMTLATMLESSGFRVVPVARADEALEILGAFPDIKAVVTDVQLSSGGMNGLELAQKIRKEQHIGVLLVSGRVSPEQDVLPDGVYYLAKPVHRGTLARTIQFVIEQGTGQSPTSAAALSGADDKSIPLSATSTVPEPLNSESSLTPRQRQVLELLREGKSNRDIALALDLSENTVKVHLSAVFRALGVSSRTSAAVAGMRPSQSKSGAWPSGVRPKG